METELVPPEYQKTYKSHTNIEAEARTRALAIKDDGSYRAACEFRVMIDKQRKYWATIIKPAVSAAHQAHTRIKGVEKTVDEPLANALETLDPSIARWRAEQETARRLEQERINRDLQKQEEDRRLAEAAELEKSGKKAEAQAVLEAPMRAPEVVLPSSTKVAGIQDRTYWAAEVFDLKLLCRAVAEGKINESYVLPNASVLNSMARSMKSAMNAEWESKGVRAVSRQDISGGR